METGQEQSRNEQNKNKQQEGDYRRQESESILQEDGNPHHDNEKEAGAQNESQKTSPAVIEKYIKGIRFPAKKEDLVKQAKSNSAPQQVLNALDRLKEQDYNSPIDISKQVKDMC